MNLKQRSTPDHDDGGGKASTKGHLFILSAPSGAGKTTLRKQMIQPGRNLVYSVSYTTRPPRKDEKDGIDYHFISRKAFKARIKQKKWAEWAEVHGHYYGTSKTFIDHALSLGTDVLLDIDVTGACRIRKHYPDCITVFILPPSLESLKERLEKRGADSREEMEKRLRNAVKEMEQKDLYHYVIVNDDVQTATEDLSLIIKSHQTVS